MGLPDNETIAPTAYVAETKGVRVSVLPGLLEADSSPEEGIFAFSYTITIENIGDEEVQLLERHWIIESGGEHLAEVVGPGVIGQQPKIGPLEVFEYTSGAVIQDPLGAMHGTYTFRSASGRYFEVEIPAFELLYPMIIH